MRSNLHEAFQQGGTQGSAVSREGPERAPYRVKLFDNRRR
jgi:hypothetical protein